MVYLRPMRNEKGQSGFTIVEIVVTLTVAGIILAMAVPSFRDLMSNSRQTTTTNNLIASISYARSEAVRRAQTVSIVANGTWQGGWTIVDQAGTIIRRFEAPHASVQISVVPADATTLRFDGRGLMSNQAQGATFSVCDNRPSTAGRQIQLSATGRPQLDRKYYDGGC